MEITKNNYKYCIYDDGCHLDESVHAHLELYSILKDVKFYIDRFHLKNHIRKVIFEKNNFFSNLKNFYLQEMQNNT